LVTTTSLRQCDTPLTVVTSRSQEAEPPQVDPHDRDPGLGRAVSDAEQRPVPAQDDDEVRGAGYFGSGEAVRPAELPGRVLLEDAFDPPAAEIVDDPQQQVLDLRRMGLDDDADVLNGSHG
jgi:hypothetical protein